MSRAVRNAVKSLLSAERKQVLRTHGRLISGLCLFGFLALLPPLFHAMGEPFLVVIATRVLIFAIAVMSLDLILGYGAMVSFGHAAYIGIGAYAVAILSSHGIGDLSIQLPIAIAVAATFALVTGAISLRTQGVHFIMITLAFGQMAFFFMMSMSAYGGDDGQSLAHRSTLFGTSILDDNRRFFYISLAMLAVLFVIANAIVGSRFGRVLTGARENPLRMQAIGFSPFRYRLTAYVISGVMAAIAGVLLANHATFVSPSYMSWQRSGELIAMVVLGGMGTLIGAILGALAFIALEEWLATFTHHWRVIFGAILIVVVLFTRGGLYGLARRVFGGQDR